MRARIEQDEQGLFRNEGSVLENAVATESQMSVPQYIYYVKKKKTYIKNKILYDVTI